MMKRWGKSTLLASTALLGMIALSGTTATAGTVDVDITATVTSTIVEALGNDLDFGSIELLPAGDVVTIDASGGVVAVATPTGASVVTPGAFGSGLITVDSPGNLTIGIAVPDTATLTEPGGDTAAFSAGIASSTATALVHTGGVQSLINIGGILTFGAGSTAALYTGTITVTLTYT